MTPVILATLKILIYYFIIIIINISSGVVSGFLIDSMSLWNTGKTRISATFRTIVATFRGKMWQPMLGWGYLELGDVRALITSWRSSLSLTLSSWCHFMMCSRLARSQKAPVRHAAGWCVCRCMAPFMWVSMVELSHWLIFHALLANKQCDAVTLWCRHPFTKIVTLWWRRFFNDADERETGNDVIALHISRDCIVASEMT